MTSEVELSTSCGSDNYQEIKLTGDDENNVHLVNSKNVTVHTSSQPYNRGSSSNRVKINNIVDYTWELKYQYGHLVAATLNGNYIAYSLQLAQRVGGAVRIAKHKSEQQRILIKDFKGQVKDLAFSYTQEIILACIDEFGNLEVHEIEDDGVQMRNKVLLRLDRDNDAGSPSGYHLLFWCPFIPDDPTDILVYKNDEPNSTLLAITHNTEVEVINVRNLTNQYGSQPILSRKLPHSLKISINNPKDVTVATFSPDGTALATGSLEGDVNFYEMKEAAFEKDEAPSCIHEWKPHDGKPISTLFFLDNHKFHQPEVQFWKFALTGADSNQEIKLWSCETWDCLQTIRFSGPMDARLFQLKAELDATGSYLLLSDLYNKSVYVLQIYQNNADSVVNVCSIAEFPMTCSVLSIAVVEGIKCRIKITDEIEPAKKNDSDQNGEEDDEEESSKELSSIKGVSIRCFWISTKSLQECRITYHPTILSFDDTLSLLSQESVAYRECLSELDIREETLVRPESETLVKLTNRVSSLSDGDDLLITQDDFASPTHSNTSLGHSSLVKFPNANSTLTPSSVPLPPISPTEELNLNNSVSSVSSLNNSNSSMGKRLSQRFTKDVQVCLKNDLFMGEDEDPLATSEPLIRRKLSQRSSGSSPSQEVADIMEPNDSNAHSSIVVDLVNITSQTNGVLKTLGGSPLSSDVDVSSAKDSEILMKSSHQDFGAWPQAPDISKELKYVSPEKPPFSNQALLGGESNLINIGRSNEDLSPRLSNIEEALQALTREISSLSRSRQNQSLEAQALQQQLNKYQEQSRHFQSLNHRLDKLEGTVSAHIQKALSDQSHSDYNKAEDLVLRRDNFDRVWMEERLKEAGNCASSTVSNKLDKAIKNEMSSVVLPNLSKSLQVWKDALQQDLLHRISLSENTAKENMNKLFKNKSFIESVSQTVAVMIQPQIQQVCKDLLYSHLLPSVEKVCQNIFAEVNEAFKQGTKEYLQQIEQSMNLQCQQTLNTFQHNLIEQNSQIQKKGEATLASIREEFTSAIASLTPLIADEVKNVLKEHISQSQGQSLSLCMDEASLLSRTMTPVPIVPNLQIIKFNIQTHLQKGQYNQAFILALNSQDQDLIMEVCESVPANQLFGQVEFPLSQEVIISIIMFLIRNLNDKLEFRINYLEESLMALNTGDPNVIKHLPMVIEQVNSALKKYTQLNPNSIHLSKLRMILLATNSLLHSS